MPPTVSELMRALPEVDEAAQEAREPLAGATMRPVPVGRWRRLRLLATLQAKIGAAYLFYWIRGWFRHADQREKMLAETHWQTAAQLLDSMSYLRGALATRAAARSISATKPNFAAARICSSRWSASAITAPGPPRQPSPA
jgi:hypothetical protein